MPPFYLFNRERSRGEYIVRVGATIEDGLYEHLRPSIALRRDPACTYSTYAGSLMMGEAAVHAARRRLGDQQLLVIAGIIIPIDHLVQQGSPAIVL